MVLFEGRYTVPGGRHVVNVGHDFIDLVCNQGLEGLERVRPGRRRLPIFHFRNVGLPHPGLVGGTVSKVVERGISDSGNL